MNIRITPSQTNLLHLIAVLLVCTIAFLTVAAPLLATMSICEEWAMLRDQALSDAETYDREAAEYDQKYQDASWMNPLKYWYLFMYHRALERAHEARQTAAEYQRLIDENCGDDNDDNDDCG